MSASNTHRGSRSFSRRGMLRRTAGAVAAGVALPAAVRAAEKSQAEGSAVTRGRVKQSVCRWCFDPMPLDELARHCAAMGIRSIELVPPKQWPILKRHGLICAVTSSHGFVQGFNDKANHPMCIAKIKESIDATSAAGFPNVITFSGFRNGIPDDVGLDHCVEGLKKVIGYAEKKKVNLVFEVLNSRVDVEMKGHPGYQGDDVEWCVEICRRVGSPRMKLLFDIYHVQVMQGDLITRIRQHKDYIGHYHTAGVPGRNELDENQEINYPAVIKAIVETGFDGYVAQEFIPTRDPMTSLRQAVKLCDV